MKINPMLSGTLLFFPLLLMSWVPRSYEDSLCIDNVPVPIIVQTLSIGTRGPALCVNAYCQFFQKVGTNFMQTYLHWLVVTCFFIDFPSIFTYENKFTALWHLALFPLAPYEQGAKEQWRLPLYWQCTGANYSANIEHWYKGTCFVCQCILSIFPVAISCKHTCSG